jgi:hypothetical protein
VNVLVRQCPRRGERTRIERSLNVHVPARRFVRLSGSTTTSFPGIDGPRPHRVCATCPRSAPPASPERRAGQSLPLGARQLPRFTCRLCRALRRVRARRGFCWLLVVPLGGRLCVCHHGPCPATVPTHKRLGVVIGSFDWPPPVTENAEQIHAQSPPSVFMSAASPPGITTTFTIRSSSRVKRTATSRSYATSPVSRHRTTSCVRATTSLPISSSSGSACSVANCLSPLAFSSTCRHAAMPRKLPRGVTVSTSESSNASLPRSHAPRQLR